MGFIIVVREKRLKRGRLRMVRDTGGGSIGKEVFEQNVVLGSDKNSFEGKENVSFGSKEVSFNSHLNRSLLS
jgi:hypothetical protein